MFVGQLPEQVQYCKYGGACTVFYGDGYSDWDILSFGLGCLTGQAWPLAATNVQLRVAASVRIYQQP